MSVTPNIKSLPPARIEPTNSWAGPVSGPRSQRRHSGGQPRRGRPRLGACLRASLLGACLVAPNGLAVPPKDIPLLGDSSSALVSLETEQRIGANFLQQIRASLPLSQDPLLKYYTDVQLRRLTQYSELRDGILSVVLINDAQINAFAAPGGVVGINLGLYLHAEDIHEYSSVVAHELAHLSQRHFARGLEQQRSMTIPTLASLVAAIALGAIAGSDAGLAAISASQAGAVNSQLRYSRAREQEADRVGLNTLINSGMDPAGMARMFDRMRRAYRFTKRPPEFLLTHPLSESRISDARNQIARTPQEDSYAGSDDYQMMRSRVVLQLSNTPEEALRLFNKRLRADADDVGARYGKALALSSNNKHAEAMATLIPILKQSPEKLLVRATQAELLLNARQTEEALHVLAHQLVLNPDNPALSMLYAKGLIASQRYDEAELLLERLSRVHSNDSQVWYELAEVAGKAGNIVGVHRARAEFFAMHGAYERAVNHLEYARGLIDPDNFQLAARLDARLADIKQMKMERDA